MATPVHRVLHQGDHGDDVKVLQREVNEIGEAHERLSSYRLVLDGQLGPSTIRATRRAAYLIGLTDKTCREIHHGRVDEEAQRNLRDRSRLSKTARQRGERRREELRKRLEAREPDFNGHPTNVAEVVKEVIVVANNYGLWVSSTTDGTSHTASSYHYTWNNADGLGHAVDLAGAWANMVGFQREAARRWPAAKEVFGPDDWYVKNGTRYPGMMAGHADHDHIAR